uniref:PDZ domain-containing protein n=1 Tax=Tetranychus urticae TaxID=32264 RepID=T1JX76_TETUR
MPKFFSNRQPNLFRSRSTIDTPPEPFQSTNHLIYNQSTLKRYSNHRQPTMRSVSLIDWPPSQYIVDTGAPPSIYNQFNNHAYQHHNQPQQHQHLDDHDQHHGHNSQPSRSSLNLETLETFSNNCDSDSNCSFYNKLGDIDEEDSMPIQEEFIQVNVYIPEYLVEQTVSLSEYETIWNLKLDIIERLSAFRSSLTGSKNYVNSLTVGSEGKRNTLNRASSLLSASLSTLTSANNNNNQFTNQLPQGERIDLNYGFYCHNIGSFLEEEATFHDYLKGDLPGVGGYISSDHSVTSRSVPSSIGVVSYCNTAGVGGAIDCCFTRTLVRLEFRHKQRIDIVIMSTTLPTSTATRRKRKRSRLIEAVANGNVEKIIKLLVNCDPNFIDEASGDTLLSLVAGNTSLSTSTSQRVIVALVNGGALLDFRTKDGRTPLHVAVQKSNYVALKTFLDLGASPNYRDAVGLTSLFYSILYSANPKLTQLLLHEHSIHGVADAQGWQEVHHACKLGLVAHLEQLLYYGCDMNCKIVGSGNTPLHVAAINDQMDCARVLLLRGCNTQIANNSHQTAYQVAVIAGNMNLAEIISNHKPENVVPYRDKPKYNPARRPPSSMMANDPTMNQGENKLQPSLSIKDELNKKYLNGSASSSQGGGGSGSSSYGPSISPCPSQRSCTTSTTISTTTTSSGVCCELDGSQSEEAGDEDGESEDESTTNTEKTSSSQHSRVEGRREQKLLGIGSSTTLPARGRREQHQMHHHQSQQNQQSGMSLSLSRQSVPSCEEISMSSILPPDMPPITSYDEKTVSLHKGSKGFGFVLRGAKATSPVVKQNHEIAPQPQPISLQYLDEIESGGVAEAAGLKRGDFLLNVNGVDVRSAPHEQVVQLIRQSGDKVTMTVAKDKNGTDVSNDKSYYKTRESRSTSKVRNPPVPPKRDPSTTLSISRARAKSLCITSSNSSDTVNSGLPMSTSTSSEMSGQQVDDQETNKSSSPSTSVESMVCPNNVTLRAKDGNGNKIASIRSRSSRRISAFELEKFFARQGDPNQILLIDDKCKGQGEGNHQVTTLQALKKKRNKKLQKDFHSTPDIQEQLALELAKQQIVSQQGNTKIKYDNNANRLSTSQEDLRSILPIYSETLTLRNGKIVQDEDSNSNCKPSTLPSTLTPASEESQSVVVKVDVSGNRVKSDYANFAQLNREDGNNKHSPNDQATTPSVPLSSFKPTLPLSTDTESLEALQKVNYASPDKLKQPGQGMVNNQQQSAKQGVNTLRPAKHVKHSSLINTDGSESLNGNQPYIPEPDYSSSEDDGNTPTNVSGRDLSTFKGTTNSLPKSRNNRMASSYHESVVNSKESEPSAMSTSTSVLEPGREKEFDVQLRAKVAAIAVASSKGSLDQRSNQSEEIRVIKSTRKDERGTISEPLVKPKGDHINKVKESIAVFERRSSLTGEGVGTSAAIAAVQASNSSSSTLTRPKKDDNTNLESSGSVSSSAANALRVSKSCFEVDICDNSSSGVSSDIDADNYTHHHHHHSQQQSKSNATDLSNRNQQIHSLNRRNSAIVSEKIANLMASGTPVTVIRANSQEARQILTNQSQHQDKEQAIRRASIASCATDKGDNLNSNVVVNSEVCSQSTGSGSKAAPTMAKTWSEISSAIRAAKGCTTTSSSTVPVKSGSNTANSGNNFTAVKQTGLRPTSAPITCNNNSNKIGHNNSNNSNSNKDGSDRSTKGRDGLAAVNEVDVLAELVPPPPEFAAPPPQPMDSRPGAIKIQVGGPKQPQKQQQQQQPVSNHQPQLTTVYHQQHQQQQQHQQHHHHHGQQTHSKMVTTLPATQGAPVNTVISGVGIKAVQQQVQQPINNQRKEEIRIINPQQAQVHIIHKPTPQQQACVYNSLACEANPQQLIRKTNTPPPPPPPEFSDLSAASRLGIVGAHLPAGHPHHHTIHFPQQHQQQAKIPYTLYP